MNLGQRELGVFSGKLEEEERKKKKDEPANPNSKTTKKIKTNIINLIWRSVHSRQKKTAEQPDKD